MAEQTLHTDFYTTHERCPWARFAGCSYQTRISFAGFTVRLNILQSFLWKFTLFKLIFKHVPNNVPPFYYGNFGRYLFLQIYIKKIVEKLSLFYSGIFSFFFHYLSHMYIPSYPCLKYRCFEYFSRCELLRYQTRVQSPFLTSKIFQLCTVMNFKILNTRCCLLHFNRAR
jgi:hypothetical protein